MATRKAVRELRARGFGSARQSRTELAGLLQEAARQLELSQVAPDRSGPTFGELAKKWLEVESRRLVAPENERRHLDHLREVWPLREGELSPKAARHALYGLLQPQGPLNAVTVNKVLSTARRVIRSAQMDEVWQAANPFELVDRLKEKKPTASVLTVAQANRVLPHLKETRRREALVMLLLGPRPGELKALRKEDVDLERGVVTWRRSNGRDSTKTGRVRVVPVPDRLLPVFRRAMADSPSELVFPDDAGRLQRFDLKLSRTLRAALAAAGIVDRFDYSCRRKGCGFRDSLKKRPANSMFCPLCGFKLWCHPVGKPMRWYDLRHSAATMHREAGCDPLVIQIVLGHTPRNTTDAHYTHLSDDYVRKHLNKLSAHVMVRSPEDSGHN